MNILYLVIFVILYIIINTNKEHFELNDYVPVKKMINYSKDSFNKIKLYFKNEKEIKKLDEKINISDCSYIKEDNYNINYNYKLNAYEKNKNYYNIS